MVFVSLGLSIAPCFAVRTTVIDAHGTTIIPPQRGYLCYDKKGFFTLQSGSRFHNDTVGMFDLDGKKLDKTEVEKTPELPVDCHVDDRKGKYLIVGGPEGQGVFSLAGRQILAPKYAEVQYVGDKTFATMESNNPNPWRRKLFDDSGALIAELPDWARPQYREFHEGLLSVGDETIAFVNAQGHLVIKPELHGSAKDFGCGYSAAFFYNNDGGFSGYLDHQGKVAIGPFRDADIAPFDHGIGVITVYSKEPKTTRTGALNTAGKFIVPIGEYDSLRVVDGGLLLATRKKKYFLLSKDNRVVASFPDDCTTVELPDKVGPDVWIPCGFGGTGPSARHRGFDGAKWGYCDLSGKVRMKGTFDFCSEFDGDLATVSVRDDDANPDVCHWGVINRKGEFVVPPRYASISIATPNLFIVPVVGESRKEQWEDAWNGRFDLFGRWLKQVDFIGRTKADLDDIFGAIPLDTYKRYLAPAVNSVGYGLTPGAMCGNAVSILEFGFDKDGKVLGWRIRGAVDNLSPPWITENVVMRDPSRGLTLSNLVPKYESISETN
jgi:hypothetical protein